MYTTSYNREFKTAQAEMIRLFSNIAIPTTRGGKRVNTVVPCLFGQRSRVLKAIQNPTSAPQIYPIIVIERGSVSLDLSRNAELQHDIAIMTTPTSYDPNTKPPTPVVMEFTVSAFSKYPEELDMILTNFIPFFNKDVFVVTPHPKLEGRKLSHQILWDGAVTFEWKSTIQNTEQDIQVGTFKFSYKTEVFGGTDFVRGCTDTEHPVGCGDVITINMSLSQSDGSIYPDFSYDRPGDNLASGFYAVPYSEDFEKFSDAMIERYMTGSIDYDGVVTNAYNERFNNAVMSNDFETLEDCIANGANIHHRSFWPYKYAANNCGREYSSLTPDEIDWSLSESGEKALAAAGVVPENADGSYSAEQVRANKELLTDYGMYRFGMLRWLRDHGALDPNGGEHLAPADRMAYELNGKGLKRMAEADIAPGNDDGTYTDEQIRRANAILDDSCYAHPRISTADLN